MEIEIRSNDYAEIRGYVNVVERFSKPIRGFGKKFVEKVKTGTFNTSINEAKNENRAIKLLIDHNENRCLDDTVAGNLELKEDNIGLKIHSIITNPKDIEEIRSGTPKGFSFGFVVKADHFEEKTDSEVEERTLEKIKLEEVSLLINQTPAYLATSVEVRADNAEELELRCCEDVKLIDNRKKQEVGTDSVEAYKQRVDYLKLI